MMGNELEGGGGAEGWTSRFPAVKSAGIPLEIGCRATAALWDTVMRLGYVVCTYVVGTS